VFSFNPKKSMIKCVIPMFTYLFGPDIISLTSPLMMHSQLPLLVA
jgi:hypothetical protein